MTIVVIVSATVDTKILCLISVTTLRFNSTVLHTGPGLLLALYATKNLILAETYLPLSVVYVDVCAVQAPAVKGVGKGP